MTLKFFKMLNYELYNERLFAELVYRGTGGGVDTQPSYFVHQGIF